MRVLLIHTNQFDFGQLPRYIEAQRGLNPPISLAYIAASIKQDHHKVQILDMDAEKSGPNELARVIQSFQPDVVGFSVMINNLIVYLAISKIVKKLNPKIIVIFGGVQINTFPEETIRYAYIDIGVIGEGEFIIKEILAKLENNQTLESINGIIFKKNGKIIKTLESKPIENLDQIPFPARELLNNNKYSSLIAKRTPITLLFTSRGCPFHCSFCSKPDFWNRWRFHSPEYVGREFQNCVNLGIKEIMVYDDIFTSSVKRVKAICSELLKYNLDITWDIRTRADMVNDESFRWLKAAGCNRICYGVESGDPHILNLYNKGLKIEKVKKAFDLTKKYGFETLAYFMIGGPDETVKSIRKTYRAMLYLEPDYIHLTQVIPYPKTKLFEYAIERGLADNNTWKNLNFHEWDSFPMFTDGDLTRKDIYEYVKKGYRLFYFRPGYIIKRFLKIKSYSQLWRYIKAIISI